MSIQEAIKATEKAERARKELATASLRSGTYRDVTESPEYKALAAAAVAQVGRITVSANVAGNSRRQHIRHTFKIDGKRASFSEVMALLVTGKAN